MPYCRVNRQELLIERRVVGLGGRQFAGEKCQRLLVIPLGKNGTKSDVGGIGGEEKTSIWAWMDKLNGVRQLGLGGGEGRDLGRRPLQP